MLAGRDDAEPDAALHDRRRLDGHADRQRRRLHRHRHASIACSPPPAAPALVRINEVESNGGTPGDWVELDQRGRHDGRSQRLELS